MIFEEMLREEKLEGRLEAKKEDILELLEDLGSVSEELRAKIERQGELEKLTALHKIAARSESLRAFEEKAEIYFASEKKK